MISHKTGREKLANIPNMGIDVIKSKFLKLISPMIGKFKLVFSSNFFSCLANSSSGISDVCS